MTINCDGIEIKYLLSRLKGTVCIAYRSYQLYGSFINIKGIFLPDFEPPHAKVAAAQLFLILADKN